MTAIDVAAAALFAGEKVLVAIDESDSTCNRRFVAIRRDKVICG